MSLQTFWQLGFDQDGRSDQQIGVSCAAFLSSLVVSQVREADAGRRLHVNDPPVTRPGASPS